MTHDVLEWSVNIVTAHLSQNRMAAEDVPNFIQTIYGTLNAMEANKPTGLQDVGAESAVDLRVKQASQPLLSGENADTAQVDLPPPQTEDPPQAVEPEPVAEPVEDNEPSNLVAQVRQTDISNPAFEGLDPWLAQRISPKTARKLDVNNKIHPSVYDDHLICLEDGATVTLLRSYVKNRYALTPEQYQEKWNLPDDYPMAPPAYIEKKRKAALKGGLGRSVRAYREKPKSAVTAKSGEAAAPKKRGRPLGSKDTKPRATAASKAAAAKDTQPAVTAIIEDKVPVETAAPIGPRRKLSLFDRQTDTV